MVELLTAGEVRTALLFYFILFYFLGGGVGYVCVSGGRRGRPHHHHHNQSLNREGRWGTTDDFATSFLH